MPSAIRAVFAGAVRRERTARGWTLRDLAAKAGISVTSVLNIEKQRTGPSLEVAALLAEALGMTITFTPADGEAEHG